MAGKLSELMTECGYSSQTSFKSLIETDLGAVPDASGIAITEFQFTGISFSPTSLTSLTITGPSTVSTTSTLSRTGADTYADYCNTNTTTLNKATTSGATNLLRLKKGATEVVSATATSGTFTLDGFSDTITFEAVNQTGASSGSYAVDAEYVGAFNGTIATSTDATITVTDNFVF